MVAVSGGVDSAALLHMLHGSEGIDIVVAHFDHGIRPDSGSDRKFVQQLATAYGLPFIYEEGRLGPDASEATARTARYGFLGGVVRKEEARAIITAHHNDDVMETAIINLLRGSGRKGLTALDSTEDIERPLLAVPKSEIIAYAEEHGLQWREDSTNQDTAYLRNYVRHHILTRLDEVDRRRLSDNIAGLRLTNLEIDRLLASQLAARLSAAGLDRGWFIQLPHGVAKETMAAWLRDSGLRDFDGKTLERLVVAAKTAEPGRKFDILRGAAMAVHKDDLALTVSER